MAWKQRKTRRDEREKRHGGEKEREGIAKEREKRMGEEWRIWKSAGKSL